MEMSQWNTLYSYLKQTKMPFFSRTGKQNRSCLGDGYWWEDENIRKRSQRVNMVQIFCIHMCKWKKRETCWNYSRNWGRRDKGEWWREWIQLWYILRNFVNVTMYLQHNNIKNKLWKIQELWERDIRRYIGLGVKSICYAGWFNLDI
jgi:hypothetical protein